MDEALEFIKTTWAVALTILSAVITYFVIDESKIPSILYIMVGIFVPISTYISKLKKYKKFEPKYNLLNISWKRSIVFIPLLLLVNFCTSTFCAIIAFRERINIINSEYAKNLLNLPEFFYKQGNFSLPILIKINFLGVSPWILSHALFAFILGIAIFISVAKFAIKDTRENDIKRMYGFASLASILMTSLFTPVGTIGLYMRALWSYDNDLTSLIAKSAIQMPAIAIMVAILSHLLIKSFEEEKLKNGLANGIEFFVNATAFLGVVGTFMVLVGNLPDKHKNPYDIIVGVLLYTLFISVFQIAFIGAQFYENMKYRSQQSQTIK